MRVLMLGNSYLVRGRKKIVGDVLSVLMESGLM